MSGENTENPHGPGEDATSDASASGRESPAEPGVAAAPTAAGVTPFAVPAPETVAIPDAEAAIKDFEVPPPPVFGAVPSSPSPAPLIPPATSVNAASANAATDASAATSALRKRSTWTPDDTWTSASAHKQEAVPPTAAQKAESRAAASRAATARDEASRNYVSPAAGGTDGTSYRGWTVTIFAGLAALLIGAIVLIAFLVGNAPLALSSSSMQAIAQAPVEEPDILVEHALQASVT